ncbi:hypothetical protein SteCoe_30683 [Stentor coeruleus]|uniref:Uncharacterized protein n=1 Tax=Stentor coeruleus TaxID=5963 RepID=A0A1R2B366_9CILI|nr:hypothetical protein SteCoe_30683 [Stentor coeruleus]
MIANSCVENLSSKLYQEYSAKLHKKRLEEIKHRNNWSLSTSFDYSRKEPKKAGSFIQVAKANEIIRENRILYGKLTTISERKLGQKPLPSYKTPKTLNYPSRRKQTEKIIKENQEFMQRLIEKPANFSVKKFKLEYEIKKKYKENLSKQKILERIQKLVKNHPISSFIESISRGENSHDLKKKRNSSVALQSSDPLS